MRILRLFIYAIIFHPGLILGQIQQPGRYEIELKPLDNHFDVISMEDKGLVIYRETDDRSRQGKKWEIIRLDTELKPIWEKQVK